MATNLKWIGEKVLIEPDRVFTNLYHHITDVDNLSAEADYDSLAADKATGVDGVTKQQYGRELESNLQELSERPGRMGYRPGAKRRVDQENLNVLDRSNQRPPAELEV